MTHNKSRKNRIGGGKVGLRRVDAIEHPQSYSDQKKERELSKNNDSAGKQRNRRFFLIAGRKKALNQKLIDAMAGGIEEHSTDEAGPKCIGLKKVPGEIENLKLSRLRSSSVNRLPSSGNEVEERDKTNHGAGHVNHNLHNIGPNHGRQSALKGIEERQQGDDGDRSDIPGAENHAHHDRDRPHANSFGNGPRQKEDESRDFMQHTAEAPLDKLIRGIELATEILRNKENTDQYPPQGKAHYHLKEA